MICSDPTYIGVAEFSSRKNDESDDDNLVTTAASPPHCAFETPHGNGMGAGGA